MATSSCAGLACRMTISPRRACECGTPMIARHRCRKSDETLGFTAQYHLGRRAVSRLPPVPAGIAATGARTTGAPLPLPAGECEYDVRTPVLIREHSFGRAVSGTRTALDLRRLRS